MKQYQRTFAVLAMLAIGLTSAVRAQPAGVSPIWENYTVTYNKFYYAQLAGGQDPLQLVPPINFVDPNGAIDMDDGTANNIPIGFPIVYNGNAANAVDININGWVSIIDSATGQSGPLQAFTAQNNSQLFSEILPNNCVAPYWGDHYYRQSTSGGYTKSKISYKTTDLGKDPNPNARTNTHLYSFTVEWLNLNINDKTNPNSIASFQLIIRQNPMANDLYTPDQRATIEFQYGPIGTGVPGSTVSVTGAAVGANDSVGTTHINALFQSPDVTDIATNTSTRTTVWPPTGSPGQIIDLIPRGRTLLNTWGDGDVLLEQATSPNPQVRENQSLFVTVADAMAILNASATGVFLDSEEGGAAFHGDANHTSGPGALIPATTFPVTVASSVFTTSAASGYFPGEAVSFSNTGGVLPAPLLTGTNYYVTNTNLTPSNFQVSTTSGGSALTITTAGTGTTFVSSPAVNPNYNTAFGAYFYYTTPYDAAYILMYLAGKLSGLPWPSAEPVPGYKSTDIHSTDISGVAADVSNISTTGSTVLVPITIRGNVDGPLSIQMDLKGLDASGIQFVGTRAPEGTLMCSSASLGRVTLATSGEFSDGQTVGYLELRAPANTNASFDLENVQVNDRNMPSSHVALKLGDAGAGMSGLSDLQQNSPNPFVVSAYGQTTIGFDLAAPEEVTLRVFDVLGHEVRTLIAGSGRAAGPNTIQWDGRDNGGNMVADGMYFYQMVTPDFTGSAKMQVVH